MSIVRGIKFEFIEEVIQTQLPRQMYMNAKQEKFMEEKISQLLADGSITEIDSIPQGGWVSNVFLSGENGNHHLGE